MNEKELLIKIDGTITGIEARAAQHGCDWSRDVEVLKRVFDGAADQFQALRGESRAQPQEYRSRPNGAPRTPRV